MRRSVLLLLFAVALPGTLSHVLYGSFSNVEMAGEIRTIQFDYVPEEHADVFVDVVAAPVPWEDRTCLVREQTSRVLSGSAADRLRIRAGTGTLLVRGVEGADAIRVSALLCASDVERLTAMDVELRRVMGPDLVLETVQPDPDGALGWSDDEYARIDLVVEVPRGIATTIADGSGPLTVIGVGELTIADGEGEIEVVDVLGSVRIADGSGSLRVRGVSGDVELRAGSGSVAIDGVGGSVRLVEGTGLLQVSGVGGDVRVGGEATGEVAVTRVGGDLLVEGEGSAPVRYESVHGRVSVSGRAVSGPR